MYENREPQVGIFADLFEDLSIQFQDAKIAEDDIIVAEREERGQFLLRFAKMQLEDEEEEEEEEQSSLGQEIVTPANISSEDPLAFTNEDIRQIGRNNSRMGYCGLQNLGNTCFMNSGLQCLSNTTELTKYFAFNLWRKDVNKDNPLGMKGKLASAYADLMLEMWKGSGSSTAPWEVKQMIGKKV